MKTSSMSEEEARIDYARLLRQHIAEMAAWQAQYDKLSGIDQMKANIAGEMPGMPPRPRHPNTTMPHEHPHPYLEHEAAKNDMVWVRSWGWMNKTLWDDVVCEPKEKP